MQKFSIPRRCLYIGFLSTGRTKWFIKELFKAGQQRPLPQEIGLYTDWNQIPSQNASGVITSPKCRCHAVAFASPWWLCDTTVVILYEWISFLWKLGRREGYHKEMEWAKLQRSYGDYDIPLKRMWNYITLLWFLLACFCLFITSNSDNCVWNKHARPLTM